MVGSFVDSKSTLHHFLLAILRIMKLPLLVAVVGPTGSGKSVLGLELAVRFRGEIINCDSMQVYRGLNIGTGKLSREERRGIPHHLIDIIEPSGYFTAGEFARRARVVIEELRHRKRMPIIVGGTGLYLRALLIGFFEGPARSERLRERFAAIIERGHLSRLHRWLSRVDPEAGSRIGPKDAHRIVRALEVYLLSGKPMSVHFEEQGTALEGFRILKLGLNPPRDELYRRINARVQQMWEKGWMMEVQDLLEQGFSAECPAFSALGYRRIVAALGEMGGREEILSRIQVDTRHYAKRQWTWFRRDDEIGWLAGFGDDVRIQCQAVEWVRNTL